MKIPRVEIHYANANPAPDNELLNRVLELAVAVGQQVLKLIRSHAEEWHIDPKKVGMMGFSAGGGVSIGATVLDVPGGSPDFVASLFGPSLMDVTVPEDAPPLIMATEADHGPVTEGLLTLYSVWKDAGKSAELHIYDVGLFRMSASLWKDRFYDWLGEHGFVDAD